MLLADDGLVALVAPRRLVLVFSIGRGCLYYSTKVVLVLVLVLVIEL
jgi:hypothetical protein